MLVSNRKFRMVIVLAGWLALCIGTTDAANAQVSRTQPDPPNILLILVDDMGYGDLGCTGSSQIKSPHIDQLAAAGLLCTQAYVCSGVCAPSRAGLITGRHPCRIGFEANMIDWDDETCPTRREFVGLHPREKTMADRLKKSGYRTGAVGKWHLGEEEVHYPTNRGFDYFCGMRGGHHDYFLDQHPEDIERNGQPVKEFSSGYATDFFTDEAIKFIGFPKIPKMGKEAESSESTKTTERGEQPWFLYLAYNAPHSPLQATDADLKLYEHIHDDRRRMYCAMMHALDRGIGRIVEHLKQTSQFDNSLIVFLSDNGGPRDANASWNGKLSGSKGNLREGGVRVPLIIAWPNRIPADGIFDSVICSLDLVPTFLSASGNKLSYPLQKSRSADQVMSQAESDQLLDGLDVLPFLTQSKPIPDRRLFWRLQGQTAVLQNGTEKLIRLAHRPAQLFKLSSDLGEQHDLAHEQNERVLELYRVIHDWERQMPTPPYFDTAPYWRGPTADMYEKYKPTTEPE